MEPLKEMKMKSNSTIISLVACIFSFSIMINSCEYYKKQKRRMKELKQEADSLQNVYDSLRFERDFYGKE